jgi:hypothetical protein
MKYSLIFIPLLFLSSCISSQDANQSESTRPNALQDEYYANLEKECAELSSYEKWFCDKSIVIMKKDWYKKALYNASWSLACPEWMTIDGIKAIGAIMYCKPLSK